MGPIAHYLNPSEWGNAVGMFAGAPFLGGLVQIILVNVLLSGDNAVVIAMACRHLPAPQRRWGLGIGSGAAVVLRLLFAAAMVPLLQLPYLKFIGGLALLAIGAHLLAGDDGQTKQIEAASRLWRAVQIVVIADIVMSFDNVLAVVEIANGDFALLAIGLAISIPLVLAGAALISALLNRLPVLVWAGAALLGWVGGETMVGDPAVADILLRNFGTGLPANAGPIAGCVGAIIVIVAGAVWRRRRPVRTHR